MEYYPHNSSKFIEGTRELSLEQIGIYILIIDLIYARDGVVPNDDDKIARILHVDPRRYRRLKTELMAAGKLRVTPDGLLETNGVLRTKLGVQVRSMSAQHAANVRWENYRKSKQNTNQNNEGRNAEAMRTHDATKTKTKIYSSSLEAEHAEPPKEVAENGQAKAPQKPLAASPSLMAAMRQKGWTP